MDDIVLTMKWKLKKFAGKLQNLWKDEDGMGTIELVLIIVVLIGLVIIFRDNLTNIINNIFATITNKTDTFQ